MKFFLIKMLCVVNLITCSLFAMDQRTATFLKQFIRPGDLVFDVGANIGAKTELYLACGAQVVCFEPQPECISGLTSKFRNNNRVSLEQLGLGSQEDVLELFQCMDSNTISTFSRDWVEHGRFVAQGYTWNKKINVQVTTLDKMIAKYGTPHFCKIDVENFEYEVLKGLTQPIPYLSFEFASECVDNTKKCIEYLTQLGYTHFNVALGEESKLVFNEWLPAPALQKQLVKMIEKDALVWGDVYAAFID